MKIESLKIQNVRSFYDSGTLYPNNGINIIIGPNGGGKTIFLNVLHSIMIKHFLKQYEVHEDDQRKKSIQESRIQDKILVEKHSDKSDEPQSIDIKLKATKEDSENLKTILDNKKKILDTLKNFSNTNTRKNPIRDRLEDFFKDSNEFEDSNTYQIKDSILTNPNRFSKYLEILNLAEILIIKHNQLYEDNTIKQLNKPFLYVPSSRQINEKDSISLYQFDEISLINEFLSSPNSRPQFEIAKNQICRIFRREKENIENFEKQPEIKKIKELLNKIGFDLNLKLIDELKNTYDIVLSKNKKEIKLDQLSSGEKQLIYFIFVLSVTNLKNGIVLIDEPDLHLHYQWQKLLLDILQSISQYLNIQLFIVTHSPSWIDKVTIKDVIRIYYDYEFGSSLFFKPNKNSADPSFYYRFLNATNNEKIFFSDFIIVCEGVEDKYVFSEFELLKSISNAKIGEIIEPKGDGEIDKLRNFIDSWKIKNYAIVDQNASAKKSGTYKLNKDDIGEYFDFGKNNKGLARFIEYFNNGSKFPEDLKTELTAIAKTIETDLNEKIEN